MAFSNWGSWALEHRLSCSKACEIFLDQGSNPHLPLWQADSLPLSHQESSTIIVFFSIISCWGQYYLNWSLYIHSWRRQWQPTPVLLPGKSHGQRSLVGCSPWGRWELDMTKRLHFHFSRSCIGKGNGNPLQYSCLENPRVGGAWWAAIYGVAQSRTQLKQLSSSIFILTSNNWFSTLKNELSFKNTIWSHQSCT